MQAQAPVAADAAQLMVIQKKLQLDSRIRSGINWFYWIAGLSLVNSAVYLLGMKLTFVVGLGITQFIDGIITGIIKELGPDWTLLRLVGLAVNICIAGMFVLMGYFGRKRVRWPVIAGLILYVLDALLVLVFQDYLGAVFHALAIFGLWGGLQAMGQLTALENAQPGESIESLRQRSLAYMPPRVTPQQNRLRWILIGLILLVPTVMLCIGFAVQQGWLH